MWMGEQLKRRDDSQLTTAEMGKTSIEGETAAVVTRGEQRELEIWTPGGYCWRPKREEEVLVIKGGTAGEERCVVAKAPEKAPTDLAAGDVCIFSGGTSVVLRSGGTVEITGAPIRLCGSVQVTGSLRVNGAAVKTEG